MRLADSFLPVTPEEAAERGWGTPDFVYVFGDAYVDHPSFGHAIISRILVSAGFSVVMLPQPNWRDTADFMRYGKPRLGFLVAAGNIDSMVAHYTAAKKPRSEDFYSPGCKAGLRPDRATIVYSNRIREAYGDVPIIIGGLEASLRRFAHYDYWDNKVRRSILLDSRADILSYGMGETSILRVAELLRKGVPVKKIRDVRGTVYLGKRGDAVHFEVDGGYGEDGQPRGYDYDVLKTDKKAYAKAFALQYRNNDGIGGKALVEYYGERMLVQNPPSPPLTREELDKLYAIPFMRTYHPMYEAMGGVPAIQEVRFSVTHNRGCFGGCNFCALAYHQGRAVRSRSIQSVVEEVRLLTTLPDFKGYIHDIGGPTANFREPACEKQLKRGVCPDKRCLVPKPCPKLKADESDYVKLLKAVEELPGVKKVFIRSGIRFDYMLADKSDAFFRKLVRDHVSGQLKVAPEHCSENVLRCMGKPGNRVYEEFRCRFEELNREAGLKQYLVPYLMSSHPGSTLEDAVELAVYEKKIGLSPEQVQDFYPTPGTASTVMYYTGIDPFTMKEVYAPTDYREKQLQRAMLQWHRVANRNLVREALRRCGREDLIGYGPECLVKPDGRKFDGSAEKPTSRKRNPDGKDGGKPGVKSGFDAKKGGKPSGKHSDKPYGKNTGKTIGKPSVKAVGKPNGKNASSGKNVPKGKKTAGKQGPGGRRGKS